MDYPSFSYSEGMLAIDMAEAAKFVKDFTQDIEVKKIAILAWLWGGFLTQTILPDDLDFVTWTGRRNRT